MVTVRRYVISVSKQFGDIKNGWNSGKKTFKKDEIVEKIKEISNVKIFCIKIYRNKMQILWAKNIYAIFLKETVAIKDAISSVVSRLRRSDPRSGSG